MEEEIVKEKEFLVENQIKTFDDLKPRIVDISKYSFYRKKWIKLGFEGYDEVRIRLNKGVMSWVFLKQLLQEGHLKIIINEGEITKDHYQFL